MNGYGANQGSWGPNWGQLGGGLAGILSGIFGDPSAPYEKGEDALEKYMGQAIGAYEPWEKAGQEALGKYQDWLGGMADPAAYVGQMMGKYKQSPYARYLTDQAMRAGVNAASASGMAGSTPYTQQMQQTAEGIASGDIQNWLNNVFGVNKMYGEGLGNVMGKGYGAAGREAGIYEGMGRDIAGAEYGKEAGKQQRWGNILGGILGAGMGAIPRWSPGSSGNEGSYYD